MGSHGNRFLQLRFRARKDSHAGYSASNFGRQRRARPSKAQEFTLEGRGVNLTSEPCAGKRALLIAELEPTSWRGGDVPGADLLLREVRSLRSPDRVCVPGAPARLR
jgi:hypothetical protein